MAGKIGIVQFTDLALAAATVKTLWQLIAAANHAVRILEFAISFDGTTVSNTPVLVELLRQTTAGTPGSTPTPAGANDSDGDTFDTTAGINFSGAEPTSGAILKTLRVHPQSGLLLPSTQFAAIAIGAGDRLGLRATAVQAVNATGYVKFEE